jgi:dTDP-4-amino-4,6-dideoxygalactose transaminase
MRQKGIGVQVNYIPAYWHPIFDSENYPKGLCPNAEDYYLRQVSLPMHFNLIRENIEFIASTLSELIKK